jgi:hypothetical protein
MTVKPVSAEVVAAPRFLEEHRTEDEKAMKMTEDYMRRWFASRPKVTIKVPDDTWVQLNGYTFIVKGGERVAVPDEVANILEEAGRI